MDFLGTVERSDGHAFAALGRQRRCCRSSASGPRELGVDVRYSTEAPPLAELRAAHDLVLAADGVNSRTREALAERFVPSREGRTVASSCGSPPTRFDSFTFLIVETEYGLFRAHVYPFDETLRTFIVETDEDTWRRAGLDASEAHGRAGGERRGRDRVLRRDLRRAPAGPSADRATTRMAEVHQ